MSPSHFKTMQTMITKLTKGAAAIACCLVSFNASAVTINDPGVVGIHNGSLANSNLATETVAAQTLLDMLANTTFGNFKTSITEYAGAPTVVLDVPTDADKGQTDGQGADVNFVGGYDYVMGKYDGPEGGYVLWYLGGAAFTIPGTSGGDGVGLWLTGGQSGTQNGRALSHYTGFNPSTTSVPEGGASIALLGLALGGMGVARRIFPKI